MYVLDNTWPCSPARHSSYTKHVLTYMVSIGSIPNKDASAPSPFLSYLGMLFIYALNRSAYLPGGCGCVYLVPEGVWVNPQPAAGKQGELAQGPILLQVLRRIHKSGKSYNPYCKWNRFFIWGGKYCWNRRQKMCQAIQRKTHRKANAAKTSSVTQIPGKGGPVTCRKTTQSRWKNVSPNPPA